MGTFKIDDKDVSIEEFKDLLTGNTNKCNYRNCGISIPSRKKYCCRKHKEYEKTYVKRENKRFNDDKLYLNDLMKQYKELNGVSPDVIELFKKIYK